MKSGPMKNEPKVFASLSSGLLARKGAARPAMRPQGFGQGGRFARGLGWDDMGFEPPKPTAAPRDETHDAFGEELEEQPLRNPVAALTPVQSPVHSQQAEIADRLTDSDELTEEGEELDETAELYDPEEEIEAPPAIIAPVLFALRSFGVPRLSARCSRNQGQGRVHAPARSGTTPQASSRLRRRRPIGTNAGHRRARRAVEFHAGTRRNGLEGQPQGINQCPIRPASHPHCRQSLWLRSLRVAPLRRVAALLFSRQDGKGIRVAMRALVALNANVTRPRSTLASGPLRKPQRAGFRRCSATLTSVRAASRPPTRVRDRSLWCLTSRKSF